MRHIVTIGQDIPCYCESCRYEIPFHAAICPQCKKVFHAVRCPACQYTSEPHRFFNGCPCCGYLSKTATGTQKISHRNPAQVSRKINKKEFLIPLLITLLVALCALILRILWSNS